MAATEGETDIHLEGVSKRFGDMTAVDDLTLSIPRGAFYALLGPSGCGKTTTLRMIGGFEDPTEGRVFLGGNDVTQHPPYRRDVNTVFQSYALFPHLSVEKNVAFGLERKKINKTEIKYADLHDAGMKLHEVRANVDDRRGVARRSLSSGSGQAHGVT